MPYSEIKKEIIDGKEKWCFRNLETGQRTCADTREKAILAMKAHYANEMKFLDPEQNPMVKFTED